MDTHIVAAVDIGQPEYTVISHDDESDGESMEQRKQITDHDINNCCCSIHLLHPTYSLADLTLDYTYTLTVILHSCSVALAIHGHLMNDARRYIQATSLIEWHDSLLV